MLTLFINGVKLKGSLFTFELNKTESGFQLFQGSDNESEGISFTVDVINKRLVQILAFDQMTEKEVRMINIVTEQLADPAKALLKTYIKSTL